MRRTGVHESVIGFFFDIGYINHLQRNNSVIGHSGVMQSVGGNESTIVFNHVQIFGESHQTATAISAHGTWISVGIVIDHFKIGFAVVFQQNQSIGTNPETPVAQTGNELYIFFWKKAGTIVNHHKIVSCSLIFIEF